MKKYVKPELFFESFELNQQIAVCDFDSENSLTDVDNCTFRNLAWGEDFYFTNSNTTCTAEAEGYCYQNSTSSLYGIFNS